MNAPLALPALDAIRAHEDETVAIRRQIHANPEMAYQEFATADLVAERLQRWGYGNRCFISSIRLPIERVLIALARQSSRFRASGPGVAATAGKLAAGRTRAQFLERCGQATG